MDPKRELDWRANRYWIFDMDGTLTQPKHDFPAIKKALGIPLDRGILESLEAMPHERVPSLIAKLDAIEADVARRSQVAPDAHRLMRVLARRGDRMGILTRNSRRNALITLGVIGLLDYFEDDCILGRAEALPKPDPDGVKRLLRHWNGASSQATLVGDNRFDVLTGRRAGIKTILVNGNGVDGQPDLWIRDLGALCCILED